MDLQFQTTDMKNTDEDNCNAHYPVSKYSPKDTNSMTSLLRKQESSVVRNSMSKFTFILRNRSKTNLELLCELLCKPVSVSLTKLSASELKILLKKDLHETKKKRKPKPRVKKIRFYKKKKKPIVENKVEQVQTLVAEETRKSSHIQSRTFKKGKTLTNPKHQIDLLQLIKQPRIQLRRIDQVINKIAQTFAKVISDKDPQLNALTQNTEKSQSELNTLPPQSTPSTPSTPSKPSNNSNNEYLQNNEIQSLMPNPDVNENLQVDNYSESNTNEIFKINNRQRRKRIRVLYDSDDSSDTDNGGINLKGISSRVIPRKVQKLRSRNVTQALISDEEDNTSNTADTVIITNENAELAVQTESSEEQNLERVNEHVIVASTVEDVPQQPIHILKNKEDCASSCVPLETDFTLQSEEERSVSLEEPTSLCIEILDQMQKPCISDEELMKKYKLFKELKVFLLKLDLIKISLDNRYSATEIEQLTSTYINNLVNSNALNIPIQLLPSNSTDNTVKDAVMFENNNSESNKSPSCVNEKVQEQQADEQLNVTSKERLKDISLSVSTLSPQAKSKNLNVQKSSRVLKKNSMIRSCNELLNSTLKERGSRKLSHNEDSEQIIANLNSSKSTDANKRKEMTSNLLILKTNLKSKDISNNNEEVFISDKKFRAIKLNSKTLNMHKCIVCDLCFKTHTVLKQHLSIHRQKQNVVSTDTSSRVPPKETSTVEQEKEPTLKSTVESPQKSPQKTTLKSSNKKKKTPQNESQKKDSGTEDCSPNKKKANFPRKRIKLPTAVDTNECSICSQDFPTKVDLAAHIFLHTESELQRAYKNAKKKMQEANKEKDQTEEQAEKATSKKSVIKKPESTADNVIDPVEKSATTVNEKTPVSSHSSTLKEQDEPLITQCEPEVPKEEKKNDTVKIMEFPVSTEDRSNRTEALSLQNDMDKDKMIKLTTSNKKGFVVCQCHNRSDINDNCLRIEIVLLCHTCRVLFRSMECFETHYRLPGFALCNQNRLESGRSPNLFCANCGMIFSSVQDVRHHLETHARFKQNFTTDFQCNICKVIFIGIGSYFYTHWSKHAKDPFWVASEQSFPKSSIVKSKSENIQDNKQTSNKFTKSYIQVAERICHGCKLPFAIEEDLKKHKEKCKLAILAEQKEKEAAVQKYPLIRLSCNLCDDIFLDKLEFYRHLRNRHKFASEPEFVCVSLTVIGTAFICSICMELSEGIDQFEEHWVKHNTHQPRFGCMYCNKECNALNLFVKHMEEHQSRVKEGIVSCNVTYQKSKFICLQCNIGFESQKGIDEHNVIHSLKFQTLLQKNKVLSQKSLASVSGSSITSSPSKPKAVVAEKQIETSAEEQINANNKTVEKKAEDSTKFNRDAEKEKLINILEGNEDSDNELTIDLTEQSEEYNELQNGEKDKGEQVVSGSAEWSTIEASVASEDRKINIPVTVIESSSQKQTSNLPANTKEIVAPKKNSPLKPKQGFLRVKTLAELRGKTSELHVCKFCGCAFENPENYKQHLVIHLSSNEETEAISEKVKSIALQNIPNKPSAPRVYQNRTIMVTQSNTILASDKSLGQLQSNVIQNSLSAQNSKSAYHKNLPACNIVQKSMVVPRSSIQKGERVPARVVVNSSNEQNIQVTSTMNSSILPSQSTSSYHVNANIRQNMNNLETNFNRQSAYKEQNMEHNTRESGNIISNTTAVITNNMSNNQNYKQQMMGPSSSGLPQYPNTSTNSINNNQRPIQAAIRQKPPNTINTVPSSFYYKNAGGGGMSIVINQTPTLQNIPTMGVLTTSGQTYEPVIYNNPISNMDPYMQQAQSVNNIAGSNDVYHVASNQYGVPFVETVPTYEVVLQSTERLICPYCPNNVPFMSEELLALHIESTHNYECDMCNQRYYDFNELTLHRLKHRFI
ncbi:uncharacterized protein LOC143181635 [Calliopsis andreniformis]|uniref:uncharacterized protein LOC143181635 n=1 Tax=Calliopsis andreniformis TaxID=337506 RepID=UPI003FCC895D